MKSHAPTIDMGDDEKKAKLNINVAVTEEYIENEIIY